MQLRSGIAEACRPAATALIQPLAWELTCAAPAALKSKINKASEQAQMKRELRI